MLSLTNALFFLIDLIVAVILIGLMTQLGVIEPFF